MADLTTRTVRGAAWTLSVGLGSRALGLIGTLVLARFLVPQEYGEVMAAAIVTTTAFGVTTLGVGIYVLTNKDLTRSQSFHATCWFLATGAVALAIVWAASPQIGRWLDAPRLPESMPLFVAAAWLDRLAFLPERMLIRKLRFRWLSLGRGAGELAFTIVSVGLAWLGFGAQAIVWGFFSRAALHAVAILLGVNWREWLEPHPLERATFVKIIRSGISVSLAGIASFLMRRWDNLLVSAFFGNATMGSYNYAYNLADTPAVVIGEQISDVVAASFPHAEGEKRQSAVVRACTMTSLVMFPLAFGLGAVSNAVVETFFDAKWESVGPMLLVLSIVSAPRPIANILHAYFFAAHKNRVVMIFEWLSLGVLVAGIATIGRLGILWTCGAVGAMFVIRTLLLMVVIQRMDGVGLRRFLRPLVRPLLVCLVMVGAIIEIRPAIAGFPPIARLCIEVALGAVVYLLGAALVFRSESREFIALLRSAIHRKRG